LLIANPIFFVKELKKEQELIETSYENEIVDKYISVGKKFLCNHNCKSTNKFWINNSRYYSWFEIINIDEKNEKIKISGGDHFQIKQSDEIHKIESFKRIGSISEKLINKKMLIEWIKQNIDVELIIKDYDCDIKGWNSIKYIRAFCVDEYDDDKLLEMFRGIK
jgi:hypothetical protein